MKLPSCLLLFIFTGSWGMEVEFSRTSFSAVTLSSCFYVPFFEFVSACLSAHLEFCFHVRRHFRCVFFFVAHFTYVL